MSGGRPEARLVVERSLLRDEGRLLGRVLVAGLPLLTRQVLGLRQAGIDDIALVADQDLHEVLRQVVDRQTRTDARRVAIVAATQPLNATRPGTVSLPADLIVDPRVIKQLIETGEDTHQSVSCVDRYVENYPVSSKSPFVIGAPGLSDGHVVDETEFARDHFEPIGVLLERGAELTAPGSVRLPPVLLYIGRYAWHRVRESSDAAAATTKILLATIKPTDGIYARTNRRISTRISRMLLPTPVTPNQVTIVALICSVIAGAVMAGGTYLSFVGGGFLMWFASMLDGVDGEVARAKFQATELGHWLEMACDYGFYLAVMGGYGVGLYRASGERVWLYLAISGMTGVVLGFLAVARNKRRYARREPDGDFFVAFQRTTSAHGSNPIHLFTRHFNFLVTRGAFPYFITAFAVLNLSKLMFLMIQVGTHLSWILTLYAGRLKMSLTPVAPAAAAHVDRTIAGAAPRVQPAVDEP